MRVFITIVVLLAAALAHAGPLPGDAVNSPPITGTKALALGPLVLGPLPAPPVPVGNPQMSDKIELGMKLYFDTRLSSDNTISCATCHDPAHGWSDAGPTSQGIRGQMGGRRAPPVANAAYFPLQFWDGRAASLEAQAIGPIANPIEMGNTHEVMIRTLEDLPDYVEEFRAVFGTTPITLDQVAQVIASFERTVVTTDSPFDRFARGDAASLTKLERRGLEIFNGKGHCTCCHWGPLFSDGRFHNLGVPAIDPAKPDGGRHDVTKLAKDFGAFKTPTLRDVGARPPYLHTGGEQSLRDVIEFYNRGGGTQDPNLDSMMLPLGLSDGEIDALVAFMDRALTSLNPEVANVKRPATAVQTMEEK
jgi:cytochrome c peroxidase